MSAAAWARPVWPAGRLAGWPGVLVGAAGSSGQVAAEHGGARAADVAHLFCPVARVEPDVHPRVGGAEHFPVPTGQFPPLEDLDQPARRFGLRAPVILWLGAHPANALANVVAAAAAKFCVRSHAAVPWVVIGLRRRDSGRG